MCEKSKQKNMKVAVHLETQEQADIFFKETNFPLPCCGCARGNWGYKHETAYHISREEFGNVRMYKARPNSSDAFTDTVILSFEQFMYLRGLTLANEYEVSVNEMSAEQYFQRESISRVLGGDVIMN